MAKTVLITGGSRGIGRATAILAGQRGWRVGVNFLANAAAASDTVTAVQAAGGAAVAIPGDVAVEADVIAMFDAVEHAFGPLDGAVVNAGMVGPPTTVAEMPTDRMRHIIEVNLIGAILCAREAARRVRPGGSIVNVSSMASRLGSPNEYVDYAAAKGGVDSLTIGLAKELGPSNIRVNAVRPGLIETEIHAAGGQPDRLERLAPGAPLRRAGTADEVAEAILWLLSDASTYTTGSFIDVAGGR
ncbi:MAG: SDR family oxidoreductase [Alphaproteobacteria bacterium]